MKSIFSTNFSMVRSPNRVLTSLKSASFEIRISSFVPPSNIFIFVWGDKLYAPQTKMKILEGGTTDEIRISKEALLG